MPHLKYLNTYWNVASDEVWLPGICALCCRIVWLSFLTVLLVISSLALSLCQNGGILIAYLCLSLFTFLSSLLCEVLIIRTSITGSISEHEDRDKTLVFYLRFRYGIAFVEILLSIFGCFVIAYREQVRNNLPCVTTVDFSSYGPIGQILLSIVIASQFIESLVIIVGTIIQYNRPVDMQPDEIIKQYKSRRRGQLSPSSEINVEEERKRKFDAFAIRGQKYLKKTFKMVQLLSCNLFGGNQIFEEEYTTLGRLLSSLFHHGGFLDLVPTDLVAGMVLVASEQKEQRRMKYSIRNNIRNMHATTMLYRAPGDTDLETNTENNDRTISQYTMTLENSSFVVAIPPHLTDLPPPPRIMDLSNNDDRKLLEDAYRYSVMALGCYTHLFAILIQPITGLCEMACTNIRHTDGVGNCNALSWANTIDMTSTLTKQSSTSIPKDGENKDGVSSQQSDTQLMTEPLNIHTQQRHNVTQDAIERGVDIDTITDDDIHGNKYLASSATHTHHLNNGCCCCYTPNTYLLQNRDSQHNIFYNSVRDRYTKSDNCWKANETGLVHLTKLRSNAKIKYASFQNNVGMKPYMIYHDEEFNEVIIAVRGTLSVEDAVTDMLCTPEEMRAMGVKWGFDGSGMYTHSGMLQSADTVRIEIETLGILRQLMSKKSAVTNTEPRLIVTGHSLGAGVAVLLSFLLRPQYPTLKCFTFGTPNTMLDIKSAKTCSDFVISIANAADVVCRASYRNTFKLRELVIDCLCRAKANKKDIFMSAWDKNVDVYKLMARPDEPLPANEFRDLMRVYNDVMRSRDSSAEHCTDIQLAIPGRVIHLKRPKEAELEGLPGFEPNDPVVDCYNRYVIKKKVVYLPCECTLEHFRDIEVDLDMGIDHFPDNYCNSLEYILDDWKTKQSRKD